MNFLLRAGALLLGSIFIHGFQKKTEEPVYSCYTRFVPLTGARTVFHGVKSCGTCPSIMKLLITSNGDSVYITHAETRALHNTSICEKEKGSVNTCPQILLGAPICPESDKLPN